MALSSLYSFIQHKTPKHGMVPPTFRVGLPISVNPLWKCHHRKTQTCVSMVMPTLVELTMKTNCQNDHVYLAYGWISWAPNIPVGEIYCYATSLSWTNEITLASFVCAYLRSVLFMLWHSLFMQPCFYLFI